MQHLSLIKNQRELFLPKVNNRETTAAIEANNDMYCLQKMNRKVQAGSCCQYQNSEN